MVHKTAVEGAEGHYNNDSIMSSTGDVGSWDGSHDRRWRRKGRRLQRQQTRCFLQALSGTWLRIIFRERRVKVGLAVVRDPLRASGSLNLAFARGLSSAWVFQFWMNLHEELDLVEHLAPHRRSTRRSGRKTPALSAMLLEKPVGPKRIMWAH